MTDSTSEATRRLTTCKHCGEEIEDFGPDTGWVETRSGDDGGYFDMCPENPKGYEEGHQPAPGVKIREVPA